MAATAMLAGTFWFAGSPTSLAANTCAVCHSNTTTLNLACDSLDYRQHKDHGDLDGACSNSTGSRIDDGGIVSVPIK